MKQQKFIQVLAGITWCVCPFIAQAQLLKGTVTGKISEVQVAISQDGNPIATQYLPLEIQKDGTFSFDVTLLKPFNDISLYFNAGEEEIGICGARLEAGKTLTVKATTTKEGGLAVGFEGINKEASDFYTRFVQAYDMMRYLPMNPDDAKPYAENRKILAAETAQLKKRLQGMTNRSLREYYSRQIEYAERDMVLRLIQEEAGNTGKKVMENPEYKELIAAIDVNSEEELKYNLPATFIMAQIDPMLDNMGGDRTAYSLRYMQLVDSLVVSQPIRKALAHFCAYTYFTFGKGGDYHRFWECFKAFARDYPELIARFEGNVKAMDKTAKGNDAFDAEMVDPEGKVSKLSDQYGRLLYIDVWATWCSPCCAEIPYLEKLVEHYRGNDRIQFISISVDSNKKAWLAKLAKDKPEWLQFNLTPQENERFSAAWGISGIPRFLMIDKNGKIYNADAPRPSDANIISLINEALNETDNR